MSGLLSAPLAAASGSQLPWYLTRATGAVALLLLTIALALGVADVGRLHTVGWPRFVVDALHRNASLLAVVFLALHVLTAVLDGFVSISPLAAVVPFASDYRPLWLGLGAVACDLLLAVIVTSVLRQRIGHAAWRVAHWLAYACWPVALLHSLGTGSDVKSAWMLALVAFCLALVAAAVLVRVLTGLQRDAARGRFAALGGLAAFLVGLLLWLPGGPLGAEWARRAGTPTALLGHATTATHTGADRR